MAEDKGKKKGKSKKSKPEPRNWAKIGLQLFIVFIMVMSVLAFTLNYNKGGSNTGTSGTDKNFKVVPITTANNVTIMENNASVEVNTNFQSTIADGLQLIPAGAANVRLIDLRNDSVLAGSAQKYVWLLYTVPSDKVFNAKPQRDMLAIYPPGHFGNFAEQFVSLTDFGTARINQSYPDYYNIEGVTAKMVNSKYFYTGATKPVVSGRIETVAPAIDIMNGNNVSAYGDYADLFREIKEKHLAMNGTTFEVVGNSFNLSYSDKFYAAVGPIDQANKSPDRPYYYVAVMHLNGTMPEEDRANLALLERAMEKMGFASYRTQAYDDYIIIEAQGSLDTCIDDMLNRWNFIKY